MNMLHRAIRKGELLIERAEAGDPSALRFLLMLNVSTFAFIAALVGFVVWRLFA